MAASILVLVVGTACGAGELRTGTSSDAPADPESSGSPSDPAQSEVTTDLAAPAVVRMPVLGIEARLVPLDLNRRGALRPPPYGLAGWWAPGPEPGEPGPAVIAGHLDSHEGPDVFAALASARVGHRVVVELADGTTVRFAVTGVRRYPQDEFPTEAVYGPTRGPRLRLITCGGAFDRAAGRYLDNVVVFATSL